MKLTITHIQVNPRKMLSAYVTGVTIRGTVYIWEQDYFEADEVYNISVGDTIEKPSSAIKK